MDDLEFLSSRARDEDVSVSGLDAEFASRLTRAIISAEKATGKKAVITSGYRSIESQREIRERFGYTSDDQPAGHGGKKIAAAPGKSRHQAGIAVDIADGAVLRHIRANAKSFGLSHLTGRLGVKDPFHIQMARDSASGTNLEGGSSGSSGSVRANKHVGTPTSRATAKAPTKPASVPSTATSPIESPVVQSVEDNKHTLDVYTSICTSRGFRDTLVSMGDATVFAAHAAVNMG